VSIEEEEEDDDDEDFGGAVVCQLKEWRRKIVALIIMIIEEKSNLFSACIMGLGYLKFSIWDDSKATCFFKKAALAIVM